MQRNARILIHEKWRNEIVFGGLVQSSTCGIRHYLAPQKWRKSSFHQRSIGSFIQIKFPVRDCLILWKLSKGVKLVESQDVK